MARRDDSNARPRAARRALRAANIERRPLPGANAPYDGGVDRNAPRDGGEDGDAPRDGGANGDAPRDRGANANVQRDGGPDADAPGDGRRLGAWARGTRVAADQGRHAFVHRVMPDHQNRTVVATFASRDAAERAVEILVRSGLAATDVHVHEQGLRPRNAAGVTLDEFATGGFFTNFGHLLDGLLGAPRSSPSYEELVRFEGVAVSAQTVQNEDAERIEALMRDAGALRVGNGRGLEPG